MDSQSNDRQPALYVGVSGAELEVESYTLDGGVVLRSTYAHVFAAFMMAFGKPAAGRPHPAPWVAVNGGFGFDVTTEATVPEGFEPPADFDGINSIWLIVSLLRLRTGNRVRANAVSNCPFKNPGNGWKDVRVQLLEAEPYWLALARSHRESVSEADLVWVSARWREVAKLLASNRALMEAFQAFDRSTMQQRPSQALLSLWGAIEELFSPSKSEVTFRISALVATYLEPPGAARYELTRRLSKMYSARSLAAHGSGAEDLDAAKDAYEILERVFTKAFADGRFPGKDQLGKMLFGA